MLWQTDVAMALDPPRSAEHNSGSRLLAQVTAEPAHLLRGLRQIQKVLEEANRLLAGLSRPSVCHEVLLSAPGTAYILGLSEVYRISKRMESGMKARKRVSAVLEDTLHQVGLAWNNLLSFLAFSHSTLRVLDSQLLEPFVGSDPPLLDPREAPDPLCGVCLTEVHQEPEVHSGNADPISYQGSYFHASCANFWLNCVDSTLPGEHKPSSPPSFGMHCNHPILLAGETFCSPPEL